MKLQEEAADRRVVGAQERVFGRVLSQGLGLELITTF